MDLTGDDLAGVVDIFGAMTREELGNALAELAFKRGETADPDAFADVIDEAIDSYQLVEIEGSTASLDANSTFLLPGPSAFPTRPDGAQDLRHILDIGEREIDRESAGKAAVSRLREDAALAVERGESETIERLIDVSYDIESWAPVDLTSVRGQLDDSR